MVDPQSAKNVVLNLQKNTDKFTRLPPPLVDIIKAYAATVQECPQTRFWIAKFRLFVTNCDGTRYFVATDCKSLGKYYRIALQNEIWEYSNYKHSLRSKWFLGQRKKKFIHEIGVL